VENIQKEIEKSQALEETYQEITDNKENTLSISCWILNENLVYCIYT
jgi:hypothetical protein